MGIINRVISDIKKHLQVFNATIIAGVFFGTSAMAFFLKNSLSVFIPIKDFSQHIVSQASAHDLDIGARISSYYIYIIVTVLISLSIGFLLFKILKGKNTDTKKPMNFLRNISTIAVLSVLVSLLLNYESTDLLFVVMIFAIPIILTLIYIFLDNNRYRDFDMIFYSISLSLILGMFIKVNLSRIGIGGTLGIFGYLASLLFLSLSPYYCHREKQ